MGQTQRISKNNTKITENDGMTCIRLHKTEVVRFNGEVIILDSGGWRTVTTKTRMNQTSNEYGLGYSVFADKGIWYVKHNGNTTLYHDGMRLERNK